MSRKGMALSAVMALVALMFALSLATHAMLTVARGRVQAHQQTQVAAGMAEAGIDYARYQVTHGKWGTLRRFTSPSFEGGQRFTVDVFPLGSGRFRVVPVGEAGGARQSREVTAP